MQVSFLWGFCLAGFCSAFVFLRAHLISMEKSKVSESVKIDGIQKTRTELLSQVASVLTTLNHRQGNGMLLSVES